MQPKRIAPLALAAACALLLALAATAAAHVTLLKSSPAANARLGRAPGAVWLLFSGPIRSGTLKVTDAKGRKVSIGTGGRDPRNIDRLLVALRGPLGSGRYTVSGSTIAADTHHQTWHFAFTVKR